MIYGIKYDSYMSHRGSECSNIFISMVIINIIARTVYTKEHYIREYLLFTNFLNICAVHV